MHSSSVPYGPRAYRSRLRVLGPLAALLLPAILGLIGVLLLRDSSGVARGVSGFVCCVFAAPLLLAMDVPLNAGPAYGVAIAASVVLWVLLGLLAARRATRRPAAMWSDFWREYLWLAAGVWLGCVIALVAANLILGRALI